MSYAGAYVIGIIIGIGVYLAIYIPYVLNLQKLLKQIGDSRRLVQPSYVWLIMVPFVSIVYAFILYPQISDSTKSEYAHRGLTPKGDFSKNLGLILAVVSAITSILQFVNLDGIDSIFSIGGLILFIVYWVKTAQYKNELIRTSSDGNFDIGSSEDLLDN